MQYNFYRLSEDREDQIGEAEVFTELIKEYDREDTFIKIFELKCGKRITTSSGVYYAKIKTGESFKN